jgi:hypothetical protein
MTAWVPEIGDIITAIISLACRGGEPLRIHRVYAALNDLKGRDVLLSGLCLSLTGAVCYSRQVDEILRILVAKGTLVLTGRDTLVVRDSAVEEAYRSLQAASRRFYGKIFPVREGSLDPHPG